MDMLKAILDIEKKAQKIAETFDLSILEEQQKTERMLKELEEREQIKIKEELDLSRLKKESELKEELDRNFNLMTEKIKKMEKYFLDNQEAWINEITEKITGNA